MQSPTISIRGRSILPTKKSANKLVSQKKVNYCKYQEHLLKKLLAILAIDVPLIAYWVYTLHPDWSVSIYVIFAIPFLVIVNLGLGLLLFLFFKYILKKKGGSYFRVFLLNSIFSPIIFYFFFVYACKKESDKMFRSYIFHANGKKYDLSFDLADGKFVDYNGFRIFEMGEGFEAGVLGGKYHRVNDTLFLSNDTSFYRFSDNKPFKMKMFDHKLIGFPLHESEIKL